MADDLGRGVVFSEGLQENPQGSPLAVTEGVTRDTLWGNPTDHADAYRPVIEAKGVGANGILRATCLDRAISLDDVVVAHGDEPTLPVPAVDQLGIGLRVSR